MGDNYVKNAVVIGCGAQHDAWQIGISEVQRQAIYADEKWNDGDVDMNEPPQKGLAVARQMAMLMYRTRFCLQSEVWPFHPRQRINRRYKGKQGRW